MKITLNSNDIHEVLRLSKADNVSFINKDGIIYIIAQELKDLRFKKQVIRRLYGYGEQGQALISIEVLKLIPKNTVVEITEELITVGKRKIKYKSNGLVDEPIQIDNHLTNMAGKELEHLLSGYYAMATDMARPILSGVCINGSDFVALDGYRLTVRTGNFEAKEQVVMDINLVNTLKKIKYDKDVEVYYNDRFIKFKFGDLEVIGNRLEGEYFKYNQIIPDDYNTRIEIETKAIVKILKDYKKNKFKLVKLNFTEDNLTVSANNENASIEESLNIELQGKSLEIAFNINYLVDTFSNYDVATLELTDDASPLVIKGEDKLDLVLPVRLANK